MANNWEYPVNKGRFGTLSINESIQKKITNLLKHVCTENSKTLGVRFDVHYPADYQAAGDNEDISKMIAKLKQKYERDGLNPYYYWVREQERSPNPHYHCGIFLDGNKVRKFNHVFRNAEKYWRSTIDTKQKGLIHHCTRGKDGKPHRNGIIVRRYSGDPEQQKRNEQDFADMHHQNSYVSKRSSKSGPKDGLRDIGISRLPRRTDQKKRHRHDA